MSSEQNKAIVRRLWEEVWNQNNLAVCDEIFDDAYATHEKNFRAHVKTIIPDSHHTIEDMIAEDGKVVTRFTITGIHEGEFLGVPGTGKPFTVTGMWIHRLENGRIVEGRQWGEWDRLGFLQQVGAMPTPS
jgi:steroid delta-isomerase-like uncharacterized protein